MFEKTLFTLLLCPILLPLQAQRTMQLLSAQSIHALPNGPEKIKAIRQLERDGWAAVDTFINLDRTMTFHKTDLAPYIDDNGYTVFLVTDASPVCPGGPDALLKMLADSLGTVMAGPDDEPSGTLFLSFVVEPDGNIAEVAEAQQHPDFIAAATIRKSLNALRAMPPWSPGTWKGKPVRVKMLATVNLRE